ncbi:hypothetical protein PWG14_16955 (plasmid) [Chromobacterium amazonense]|uniref:hypothetical protein n=1 Tax=Chromobacterium amazonense TaxID=1382803 RepID=UPI00237D52E3|nr:hypothetical protein [Chromobacterium amazonense]MDE1714220.1 hypothetical protein [Chromobacterium amazonense]
MNFLFSASWPIALIACALLALLLKRGLTRLLRRSRTPRPLSSRYRPRRAFRLGNLTVSPYHADREQRR